MHTRCAQMQCFKVDVDATFFIVYPVNLCLLLPFTIMTFTGLLQTICYYAVQ